MRHLTLFTMLLMCLLVTAGPGDSYAQETIPGLYEESYALEAKGDYAGSLNRTLKILRLEIGDYTATLRAGWLNYLAGRYDEARGFYEKAAALRPGSVEPLLGLMLPQMAQKKMNEAEKTAQEIVKKDRYNYTATIRLAYLQYNRGAFTESMKNYQTLLILYPADIEVKLGIAWCYVRMGNSVLATQFFNEVLNVSRRNANALAGLAFLKK